LLLANNAAVSTHIFGLPNSVDSVTDEHGWTVIPFGMWPHTAGYQRFGQKEAEAIVSAFKSGWQKLKRVIVGLPVFKGHPDNPEMANQYPDKSEYGSVADMEVRDDGLAIKHVLNGKGASLVANGTDRISPNWFVDDTGERKNGRPIYAPTSIKSVGLVKKPNIPNLSLVNSKENDSMKDLLIKLLGLANEATDEQIVAGVTALAGRPEATELANTKNELAVASAKVTTLAADLAAEKTRADQGATALANARTERVTALVNDAIKTGRIVAADKATWTAILMADADGGAKILANVKPAIKTRERVDSATAAEADRKAREAFANGDDGSDAGPDGNELANKGAKIQKLVNAEMDALKNCGLKGNALRNRAWANVKGHMPSLFTDSGHDDPDETTKPNKK
jgi:hypothetical protein